MTQSNDITEQDREEARLLMDLRQKQLYAMSGDMPKTPSTEARLKSKKMMQAMMDMEQENTSSRQRKEHQQMDVNPISATTIKHDDGAHHTRKFSHPFASPLLGFKGT